MAVIKQNIVLSPTNYNGIISHKGLLSLDLVSNKLFGKLKLININSQIINALVGIEINSKLHKFVISRNDFLDYSFLIDNVEDLSHVKCVVLDNLNLKSGAVLWGSTTMNNINKSAFVDCVLKTTFAVEHNYKQENQDMIVDEDNQENEKKKDEVDEKEELIEDEEIFEYTDDEVDEIIDEIISDDNNFVKDNIDENISFREPLRTDQPFTKINSIDSLNKTSNSSGNFYDLIHEQVEKMLVENEKEKILEEIINDSVFVKIPSDDTNYNVFGIIKDEEEIKYICYGVFSEDSTNIPQEFEAYYQWLPINTQEPTKNGYFMMYQDAITGENLEMDYI